MAVPFISNITTAKWSLAWAALHDAGIGSILSWQCMNCAVATTGFSRFPVGKSLDQVESRGSTVSMNLGDQLGSLLAVLPQADKAFTYRLSTKAEKGLDPIFSLV